MTMNVGLNLSYCEVCAKSCLDERVDNRYTVEVINSYCS